MHTAKCEKCGAERRFVTYGKDWPTGWIQTGMSKYGKVYHRKGGLAWWCPGCQESKEQQVEEPTAILRAMGLLK